MKFNTSTGLQRLKVQTTPRHGEESTIFGRKQRFYTIGTEWYFHTREGIEQGPYKDLLAAKDGLKLFLRRCGIVRSTG